MSWKESKYNLKVETEEGDLLLYNSYIGSKSLVKIKNCDLKNFNNSILPKLQTDDSMKEHDVFYNKGIIVHSDENEDEKLKLLYLNVVASNALTLIIIPTEQCNFRCKYCYESFENKKMDKTVQDSIIKYVKKNIGKYSSLKVLWFGGEPLIAIDVIENLSKEFMAICKANRKTYSAQMTTNGYFLDAEMAKRLFQYNVYSYQITIDGEKKNHDLQRPLINGKGTYDVIINNLIDIKNNFKNRHINILLRTNVTKEIYETIEDYVEFINNTFGEDSRFKMTIHQAGNWLNKTDIAFQDKLLKESILRQIYEKLLKSNIFIKNMSLDSIEPGAIMCYSAYKSTLLVSSNGIVHRCTLLFQDNNCKIGEINEKNEIQIDSYQLSRWIGDFSYCDKKDCFYAPCCLGDQCPASRLGFIDCDKEASKCPVTKYSIDLQLKMLDKNGVFEEIYI